VVGQRERKVESGNTGRYSGHVGRELQRLYKDTLTTYRRYTLSGRPERKESGRGERGDRLMFLPMLAGSCRGCTRTRSPPTGGTLCGRPERKESGEWKHR
jgi:hypothetical protein